MVANSSEMYVVFVRVIDFSWDKFSNLKKKLKRYNCQMLVYQHRHYYEMMEFVDC